MPTCQHVAVPVDDTLARIRQELAAGRTGAARQRLRGLIASFPERLEFRSMLADTYRAEGELGQAGRWSYLDPTPDPAEVSAFLATYAEPVQRMRKIRWRDAVPLDAAGPVAAARLTELRTAAEAAAGRPVSWQEPRSKVPARPADRRRAPGHGRVPGPAPAGGGGRRRRSRGRRPGAGRLTAAQTGVVVARSVWPWTASAVASRRRSSHAMAGVAATPCTSTEPSTIRIVTRHSCSAPANSASSSA